MEKCNYVEDFTTHPNGHRFLTLQIILTLKFILTLTDKFIYRKSNNNVITYRQIILIKFGKSFEGSDIIKILTLLTKENYPLIHIPSP